ncbi:hypothetical protein [Flavobacterium sp. W20_MBD1_R3]|uniref:hypothetical protein n=1 Tax=Flavobacterium sp. W20_MBD1_R3 TaxID=3240278 RepID=UPI003F8DB0C9
MILCQCLMITMWMFRLTKKNGIVLENTFIGLYFSFAVIEILAEIISFEPLLFAFRPLTLMLLMCLYWITSKERSFVFFTTIFFALVSSIVMEIDPDKLLLYGVISFVVHRMILIFYILKLNKTKDFIPIIIAFFPFIFIFSYLISSSVEIPEGSYNYLVIQNILVSIIGGIVLSNYFMNETKESPWLSIFGLLSIGLYFIVFIEKWFSANLTITYFRPLGMILHVMAYYSFYKFVIDSEKSITEI